MTTPRQGSAGQVDVAEPPVIKEDTQRAELVALVHKMAGGDERALAEFYDRTVGKAYGLALRIVSSRPLAEEIVADSFYQAWKQAAAYDSSRASPITWLLVICRSRALDALRARDPASLHESPEVLVSEDDAPRDRDSFDLLAALETRHGSARRIWLLTVPSGKPTDCAIDMPSSIKTILSDPVLPDEVAEALAVAIAPSPPAEERAADIRACILDRVRRDRQRFLTVRTSDGTWLPIAPGVAVKHLQDDGTMQSFLLRLDAGASLPAHDHPISDEHCIVVEGSVRLGDVEVSRGDYHVAYAGSSHGELVSDRGAILYLRTASGTVPRR